MTLDLMPGDLGAMAMMLWTWSVAFFPRLAGALVILVVGFIIAGWAARAFASVTARSTRLDPTLKPIIRSIIRYAILVVVIVAALGQLGVQTASILAVLGAAGLAIGLALQGTLSNIAAGMMLLWLRPFRVGDYIETENVAGTVEEIGLFNAQIRTWDGIYKFVPNASLWNTILTNYSRNPTRLVLIEFGIAYENDVATGRRVLAEFAAAHPEVLRDPPVAVVPLSLADSAVVLQLRAWCRNATFWDTRWALTEGGKTALEAAGLTIPFPQRVVHITADSAPPAPRVLPAGGAGPAMPAAETAPPRRRAPRPASDTEA